MNNEIKEILIQLEYFSEENYKYYNDFELNKNQIKQLLDYITNLQQENERKERLITQYGEGMCAYANRIDKAVEYITSEEYYDLNNKKTGSFSEDSKNYFIAHDNLLNILQNGGDDK